MTDTSKMLRKNSKKITNSHFAEFKKYQMSLFQHQLVNYSPILNFQAPTGKVEPKWLLLYSEGLGK